jgi:hypothetical protein
MFVAVRLLASQRSVAFRAGLVDTRPEVSSGPMGATGQALVRGHSTRKAAMDPIARSVSAWGFYAFGMGLLLMAVPVPS